MRNVLVGAALILLVTAILGVAAFLRPSMEVTSPEDMAARRIVEACGIGSHQTGRADLSVNLARRLGQFQSGATVSSERVGAIVDAVGRDAFGVQTYEIYVRCLREQTELSLLERGVKIQAAPTPVVPAPVVPPPSSPAAQNSQPATPQRREARADRPTYETHGNCSPIIVDGNVQTLNQNC